MSEQPGNDNILHSSTLHKKWNRMGTTKGPKTMEHNMPFSKLRRYFFEKACLAVYKANFEATSPYFSQIKQQFHYLLRQSLAFQRFHSKEFLMTKEL